MTAQRPRGGRLAALDELESITREHAVLSRRFLGTRTMAFVAIWVLAADRLLRSSALAGLLVFAAGVPAAAVAFLAESRRLKVDWSPADEYERKVWFRPWRGWLFMVQCAVQGMSGVLMLGWGHPQVGPPLVGVGALVTAVVAALIAGPWLLRRGEAGAVVLLPALVAGLSWMSMQFARGDWLVPGVVAVMLVALAAFAWSRGRSLRRLDRRVRLLEQTSVLREHAE